MTETELITLLKQGRWSIQGFNGMPLYLDAAATESGWLVNREFGQAYTRFFYLFSKGRAYMYYDEEDWLRMSDLFYEKVRNLAELQAIIAKYDREFIERATPIDPELLSALSDAELVAVMKKGLDQLRYSGGIAHVIEGVTFGSEERLRKALSRTREYEETEFSTLCSPTEPSFLLAAQKRLWEIHEATDKEELATAYIKDFEWVQTTYLGPKRLSVADVIAQANAMQEAPSSGEYERMRAEKNEIIEAFSLSPDERFLVSVIEACFTWQDNRKANLLKTIHMLEPVLEAISERFQIPLMPLKFAAPGEFDEIRLADPAFRELLEERCRKSALYVTPDTRLSYTGDAFDRIASALEVSLADDVREMKGVTASKGYAKGIARICESVSDIDKFVEGDILVASMTRPEYLPAMHKAIAFVTNEGGITCHAAIVSREMGKPCVIGTKIATQVIKDGDTIEVDANAGVVRILEKAAA